MSGLKSFGWDYEEAMRRWVIRARIILAVKRKHKNSGKKILFVKYEDIVQDEKKELLDIFNFMGLSPDSYDFGELNSLGVTGSSDIKKKSKRIHWRLQKKNRFQSA